MSPDQHRFVILRHDHPYLHWDFLVEREQHDALQSWRLLREPICDEWIRAEALPDHRIAYLAYEGPVSGGRGYVRQVNSGIFWTENSGHPATLGDVPRLDGPSSELSSLLILHLEVETGEPLFRRCTAELFEGKDGRLFWLFRRQSGV